MKRRNAVLYQILGPPKTLVPKASNFPLQIIIGMYNLFTLPRLDKDDILVLNEDILDEMLDQFSDNQ